MQEKKLKARESKSGKNAAKKDLNKSLEMLDPEDILDWNDW